MFMQSFISVFLLNKIVVCCLAIFSGKIQVKGRQAAAAG